MSHSLVPVAHVRVVTGQGGGPDKTILRSVKPMRERGYEELCVYLRPPTDAGFNVLERHAQNAGAELMAVDDRGPFDMQVVRRLIQVCRERRIQIWHGHDYKSNALGLLVRRFVPLRLVTTVHGWVHRTSRTPLYYFIDRCCLRFYDRVLCVSPDLMDACARGGVPHARCSLLPNAIDTSWYRRTRDSMAAKKELGFPADEPLMGAIGRLSPEKGFDVLVRAIAELRTTGRWVRLVIVGEGPQRAELQALVDRLGLAGQVMLPGHASDVRAWLEAMDVFVLSSFREAMPNVVLEAMAMETPIVATSVAGVPFMLHHGQTGLFVPPGDPSALAATIDGLLRDDTLRHGMARHARSVVCERFEFGRRMDAMQSIYDDLLRRIPTTRAA